MEKECIKWYNLLVSLCTWIGIKFVIVPYINIHYTFYNFTYSYWWIEDIENDKNNVSAGVLMIFSVSNYVSSKNYFNKNGI